MSTRPAEFVTAKVDGERGVAEALKALRQAGVPRDRIDVLTDVPMPETVLGGPMRRTRLLRFTFTGLVVGLLVGSRLFARIQSKPFRRAVVMLVIATAVVSLGQGLGKLMT